MMRGIVEFVFKGRIKSERLPIMLVLSTVGLLAGAATIHAENAKTLVSPKSQVFELTLAELVGDSRPHELSGVDVSLHVSLPVPALWQPKEAVLELKGTASQALIKSSQLIVSVNDRVIGQYVLDGNGNSFTHKIPLPVDLLKHGFNDVKIKAVQHYTDICEVPMAPQLWTQISLEDSKFVIAAEPKRIAASLASLDQLFDRINWDKKPAVPVFAPVPGTDEEVSAMGLVAQGIGRRYDFVPVQLAQTKLPEKLEELNSLMPEGSHAAVVMGTFPQLKNFLGGFDMPTQAGPVVAIQAMPNNPDRYVIFLSGNNVQELADAASAFAIPGVPWPDGNWAAINQVIIPNDLENNSFLLGTDTFPLRALGFTTTTHNTFDTPGTSISVWNDAWQGRMQVRVHLSYASGMSNQSALNVLTNGVLHGSIPLDDPKGGGYDNYAVTIPAGAMKPGWNKLEFKPVLIPMSNGGKCQSFFVGNLGVTLYEDTTIQKFGGDQLTQTDLASISGYGRIVTDWPLGKQIAFHMTDRDERTLSAGMTLMAKFSQLYDRPLLNSWFGVGQGQPSDIHTHFWIGAHDALPENIKNTIALSMPGRVEVGIPLVRSVTVQVHEGGEWLSSALEKLRIRDMPSQTFTKVNMDLSGPFSKNAFALSSRDGDRHLIVFTAGNPQFLQAGINTIIDYGQWAQLRGMLSYWLPGGKQVNAVSFENIPFSAYGLRGGLGLWVSQYPWLSLFALLLLMLGLVLLTRLVLRQYKLRNHQDDD